MSILFWQKRYALNGWVYMPKIRTMIPNADAYFLRFAKKADIRHGKLTLKDDPRVTTIGRILRTLGIDEIPELYSLVRKNVNLVGLRPLSEKTVQLYREHGQKNLIEARLKHSGIITPFSAYPKPINSWEAFFEAEQWYVDNKEKNPSFDSYVLFRYITTFRNRNNGKGPHESEITPLDKISS